MAHPEGRMREIVELLSKFSVDKLNNDWVTHVIDSDFTEVDDLPPVYEDEHVSTNFKGLFSAVIGSCRQWIDSLPNNAEDLAENRVSLNISSISEADRSERDTHTRFWLELSENVKVKSLMALLFYYIHRGQRYDAREPEREFGIQGADVYFLMLCIPGSNAFRIFHPVMYLKALDVLRLTTKLNVALSSPSKKGRGAGGRGSAGSQRAKSHDGPAEDDEEESSEMAMLSPHETSRLCRSLNVILHDFLRLTTRFSLKHSPESLDETVSILCDVTCSEIHDARAIFMGRHRPDTVTALTYNAYIALQGLCNTIHGKIRKTIIVIFKYIINNILMTCRGSSELSVRAVGVIKDHSLIFVKYILTQLKEEAHEGVYILVQQLCIRVTDKSEYRQKTATSVVEILRYLPLPLYSRLIKWFHKFSHNEKASHRMFMLEVISKLLGEEERQAGENESGANGHFNEDQTPQGHITNEANEGASDANVQEEEVTNENGAEEGSTNEDLHDSSFLNVPVDHSVKRAGEKNILSHRFLLSIIFSRARDNAATVRSKALAMLAECTHSSNPSIIQAMREIFLRPRATVFSTPHIPGTNINMESPVNQETTDNEIVDKDIEKDLPNAANVMSMLHRRALDDKVTVRKSALQVLENLMKLDNGMINAKNMEVLMDHCRDPALLVRKEMIKALTNMLETYPELDLTANNWVKGVLPLILDPEMKVQEMVVTMLDKLLFKRLLPHGCRGSDTADSKLPWHMLKTVNNNSYHKFFNKTLMLWAKSDLMTPGVIRIAQTHIGHENNTGVWTFLAPLSNFMTIKDPTFAVDYFEENCGTGSEVGTFTLNQVLKVLNNSIKHIPGERTVALQQQLLEHVTNFSVGVELIPAMCDTITLLSYSLHGKEEEGQNAIEVWAWPILQACDDHLQSVLFSNTTIPLNDVEEEALFRHLFTMGEIAMLIPSKVNKRMFLMLQSIIFHTPSKNNNLGAIPENYDIPDSQTQRTQPPSTSFIPSPRAQALSVVTLGKMCLQHEDQAKRIIPALGKMLDTTNDSAIKVNIVFTLSDMCVRYATLVDPLLPQVTACLRDPDVIVRRTTLTLVINLLQEDYLKLKGSFYYRILQCLTDEHEEIRDTVVFYVTERLLKRFPKIICQHFIECIFHYNCYEEHDAYNKFPQSKQEKELFNLAGPEHKEEREMLYRFMLDHMPDDQRFATTQRLCQDVLGGVVEGKIKLNAASLPMLQDTLCVLSSDEIKLASLKSRPEDQDQPTDQAEQAAMAGQAIKKTIISQVVKRNVIENIVPILIAMKHKLEEARSPLMKHLLLYLKEVLKDYKNEVKEILAGDKQLAKEIDFDLRRFDQEQREEEEKRIATAAAEASRPGSPDEDVEGSPSKDAPRTPGRAAAGSPKTPRGAPKTPVASAKELLKQAVLNSKNIAARRNSLAVTNGEERLVENEGESAASKRRASVADFRNNDESINGDDQIHVDPRPLDGTTILETSQDPERESNESSEIVMKTPKSNRKLSRIQCATPSSNGATPSSNGATPSSNGATPKGKTPTREELLRAISTPHAVINNITFMDNSQELSNISMETSALNQSSEIRNSGDKQPALLLHLMSPEAFANKESDFSKLRRASTRRSLGSVLDKEDEKEKESKKSQRSETLNTSSNTTTSTVRGGKKNRKSGGLFESLASQADTESDKSSASQEDTETESVASELSDDSMSVSSIKSSKKSSDKEKDSRESSPNKPSRKESKVRSSKGKRSRVMASLSPDPGNTTPNTVTNAPANVKPSQKKSKKKSK